MSNWADLPRELLVLINQRLPDLFDQIRFSGVCSSWRSVGVEYRPQIPCQLPGLMIPSTKIHSKTRRFLRCFPECKVYEQPEIQVPHEVICNGSMESWLVVTDKLMEMRLLNPFSGAQIPLPSVTTLPPLPLRALCVRDIEKAILSSNPSFNQEAMVLVLYTGGMLAFCKLGDEAWIPIELMEDQWYHDALYHNGKFYAIYNPGHLVVCDTSPHPKITKIAPAPRSEVDIKRKYLVEAGGDLFLVVRDHQYYVHIRDGEEEESDIDVEDEEIDHDDGLINNDDIDNHAAEDDDGNFHEQQGGIDNNNNDDDDDDDDESDGEEEESDIDVEDEEYDHDDGLINIDDIDNHAGADDDGNIHEQCGIDNNNNDDDDDDYNDDLMKLGMIRNNYRTIKFTVYKLLESKQKWVRVESVGNYALFLGLNNSYSLRAADYPGCEGDCIYFTDDLEADAFDLRGGHDIGIFNLKNKTVEPLYPINHHQLMKPPPIWITPIPW